MNWQEERDKKRHERDIKRHLRAMSTPVSRGETINVTLGLEQQLASLALAMEALDTLLIAKGVLIDNELLDKMKSLANEKKAAVEAEAVATEPKDSTIIVP